MKTSLFYHPKQKDSYIKGYDLEKYLIEEKLIDRCLSLDDQIVKDWIAHPETYPEEYRKVYLYLWKSTRRDSSGDRLVASLIWDGGQVIVFWDWLGRDWSGGDPALLASVSSESLRTLPLREETSEIIAQKS